MSTFDDHLISGLKALERLRPLLDVRRGQRAPPATVDSADETADVEIGPSPVEIETLSLQALLESRGPFPPYSAILGLGEDGLPFLLDLTNPAPGALAIAGDRGSGKTRLLRAILASAIAMNPSEQVAFSLIANDLDEYADISQAEHCLEILPVNESLGEELEAMINELAGIVEERRRSTPGDPAILLAIDGLEACLESLSEQGFARLYYLIKHGPRSRVWTLAILSSDRARSVDPRVLAAFRTRLVGFIRNAERAEYLSGDSDLDTQDLESGAQFYLPYGEGWFRFWICKTDVDE
jgi:hypothetical protein